MLWIVFGLMLLAAALVVVLPQYLEERQLTLRSASAIIAVLAISGVLYSMIGQPDAMHAVETVANDQNRSIEEMVESLSLRLESDRNDLDGWKMLARSYVELERYPEAISAYEHVAELESYANGQTLVDLGEAMMRSDDRQIRGRAGDLIESGLVLAPDNQKALFYGGMVAAERGNPLLAAERWEAFLATSPPADIAEILRQRIAQLRGTDLPAPAVQAGAGTELTINVKIDAAASAAIDPGATVFIIARDPVQPAPPLAVVRRKASELPFKVALDDADSMLPGRVLSNFTNLELIVRASASGQALAQSGDWFGSLIVDTGTTQNFDIVISQQVP